LDTEHTEKTENNREYTEDFRAVREIRIPKKAYPELTLFKINESFLDEMHRRKPSTLRQANQEKNLEGAWNARGMIRYIKNSKVALEFFCNSVVEILCGIESGRNRT
jgi:hypothetical protein